jgi:hypothetical protein
MVAYFGEIRAREARTETKRFRTFGEDVPHQDLKLGVDTSFRNLGRITICRTFPHCALVVVTR